MCGIFGVVPTKGLKPQQVVRSNMLFGRLMRLSSQRGMDAAGAAVVQKGGDNWLLKNTLPGDEIVHDPVWTELMRKADNDTVLWMGHTRAATCGPNIPKNAHPFYFVNNKFGSLLGSHNGMIFNHDSFDGKTNTNVHDVDSACLFSYLADHPQSLWGEVLSDVWGSYALAIYRDRKIHLMRNEYSPLVYTYSNIIASWVYASTPEILKEALGRSGLSYTKIEELPENRIYSLPEHNSGKLEIQIIPVVEETKEPCVGVC